MRVYKETDKLQIHAISDKTTSFKFFRRLLILDCEGKAEDILLKLAFVSHIAILKINFTKTELMKSLVHA